LSASRPAWEMRQLVLVLERVVAEICGLRRSREECYMEIWVPYRVRESRKRVAQPMRSMRSMRVWEERRGTG
jgi:hypothetical protein